MNRRNFLLAGLVAAVGCRREDASAAARLAEEEPAAAPAQQPVPAPATAAAAAAQDYPILGINSHLLRPDDLRLVRDLGITHVRSTIYTPLWAEVPSYQQTARENTERAADLGLKLMYVVHNAYGEVFRLPYDPGAARAFTRLAIDIISRLPRAESWQLWNEQDVWVQAPFGAGERPPQGAMRVGRNYGRWWSEAYAAIKDAHPQALLVTGGTADHEAERWRGFLRGMMETGIEADAIAVHAYGPWPESRQIIAEAAAIVGDRAPLWVTECGAKPGSHWSPAYQAEAWRSTIRGNQREQLAERLYPYSLETDPAHPAYGVRDVDGTPRPVLDWLHGRLELPEP